MQIWRQNFRTVLVFRFVCLDICSEINSRSLVKRNGDEILYFVRKEIDFMNQYQILIID